MTRLDHIEPLQFEFVKLLDAPACALTRLAVQLLDFELLRALYINYLCNKRTPCHPQRWITALEAVLESSPQALIQLVYLVRTDSFGSNPLVVVSLMSSIWCIVSKLTSDDKLVVVESAEQLATMKVLLL